VDSGTISIDADARHPAPPRILVLGVGNVLWADEGFGVRCVEAFVRDHELPAHVQAVDGGTQGLYLVDLFRANDKIIVFDAIDFDDAPGEMRIVRNDDVPSFISQRKMSLHQSGLHDVIACSRLMGATFTDLVLIGIQPVELEDWGGSLRPQVKARIPDAVAIAVDLLREWGTPLQPRAEPLVADDIITPELSLDKYESERPSADAAFRYGDERVLLTIGMPTAEPSDLSR
jgi:hydrogenase maturation protease